MNLKQFLKSVMLRMISYFGWKQDTAKIVLKYKINEFKIVLKKCYVENDLIFWVEIGYGQRHQLGAICQLMGQKYPTNLLDFFDLKKIFFHFFWSAYIPPTFLILVFYYYFFHLPANGIEISTNLFNLFVVLFFFQFFFI